MTTQPFRITGPGKYRRRDGRVVYLAPLTREEGNSLHYDAGHRWRYGRGSDEVVTDAGRYWLSGDDFCADIIARVDAPALPSAGKGKRRYVVLYTGPSAGYCVRDAERRTVEARYMTRALARRVAGMMERER